MERAGQRRKTVIVVIAILVVLGIVLFNVADMVQLSDKDQCFGVLSRSQTEAESLKKSPELQLVGYATCHRRYGIFNPERRTPAAAMEVVRELTILCRNGQYFAAYGTPDNYLRTLLRKQDYPVLAKDPTELRKLQAASDHQALEEVTDLLRKKDW